MLNHDLEEYPFKDLQIEQESNDYQVEKIAADDLAGITAQLRFEMENGITKHDDPHWPEKTAVERQLQMQDDALVLQVIRSDGQIIASTELVLKNGTKGKEINDQEEAWASGTVIKKDLRSRGIGELCAAAQEKIAKEAGRTAILTTIWNDNYSSMRLRMRHGYRLIGEGKYKNIDPKKPDCKYRKDLTEEPSITKRTVQEIQQHLHTERQVNRLPVVNAIAANSPDQVLIDPSHTTLMNQAFEQNYVGVYLLTPRDIPDDAEIDKNFVVFIRTEKLPENQSRA